MTLELLFGAALEAGLSLIAEVGFRDAAEKIKRQVTQVDCNQLRDLVNTAAQQSNVAALLPLLAHAPFQEEVVSALLDPTLELDLAALAAGFGDRLPAQRDDLRRFFENLENVLTQDAAWGPILERYSALRQRRDVQRALQAQNLAVPTRELVGKLSANLTGAGGLAQGDHAVAAGAGGIAVGGDVQRIVHLTINKFIVNQRGPEPPRPELPSLRLRYLERLRRHCATLPLAALGGEEGSEADLTLDQIYIELDTRTPTPLTEAEKTERQRRPEAMPGREMDTRPLTAIEAASQATRLVLLGDPGAGKSTFVRKLAGWQAAANANPAIDPPPGFDRQLLPIVIVLRDLAAALGAVQLNHLSANQRQQKLADLVRDQALADLDGMECADFAAELRQAFYDGQCLLILDGLDEAPYDLRPLVREAVAAVSTRHRPKRTIVTCRVRSYTAGLTLPGFQEHTLAPFDERKISRFAAAWYNAQKELGRFTAGQAEARAADLAEKALGADLRELAENPMLLTTMAIIHQKEIGLPRERVRLYSLAVDVLLRRWQKRKVGESLTPSPELAHFLADDLRLRRAVERLAYEALRVERGKAADLPRGDVLALLEKADYLDGAGLAHEFLDYVDQRAGLLVGRGGEEGKPATYSFPHRTFQEYLAGGYLVGLRGVDRVYYAHAAEGDYFGLAARLGAEELWFNRQNPIGLLDLAYRLCPVQAPRSTQDHRAWLWSGYMAAMVGREEVARDTGSPDGGEAYLGRLLPRLKMLLRSNLTPVERADAGVVLCRLGDDRSEVMTVEGMEFCYVPAGRFWMGSGDGEGYDDERPQHPLELPACWIGRYPVTNAQFAEFVQAGGYDDAAYWPEAEAAGYWQVAQGYYNQWENAPRRAPAAFGDPFDLPNHPVAGVSWYEALAFSRWLSEKVGREFRLPNEPEWEKAARGGEEVPTEPVIRALGEGLLSGEFSRQANPAPRRVYPWGDVEITVELANYAKTGIDSTSAVGCFPAGASPYGVEEMAGNVWEWTRSLWGDRKRNFVYPYDANDDREKLDAGDGVRRVLRGGSWSSSADFVRCAYRSHIVPRIWFNGLGSRLVAPGL